MANGRKVENIQYYNRWSAENPAKKSDDPKVCLLYTSDAADERSSVDLGGRRIIKKKKKSRHQVIQCKLEQNNRKLIDRAGRVIS